MDLRANPRGQADVAIVGSGIIALHIAYDLLAETELSVAVVERADALCAGATGAGQGYVDAAAHSGKSGLCPYGCHKLTAYIPFWIAHSLLALPRSYLWQLHRDPLNVESWKMAEKGRSRWRQLAEDDPAFSVQTNGSLLLATNANERDELKSRVDIVNKSLSISEACRAVFLPTMEDVVREEPALFDSSVPIYGGAMLLSDSQIDGQATTKAMFAKCAQYSNRFQSYFGAEVDRLIVEGGIARGLSCANGLEIAAGAICVCAGAWTSELLSSWLGTENVEDTWRGTIIPRRGHLLVVRPGGRCNDREKHLVHGIMESSYTKHYQSTQLDEGDKYDITFTATQSSTGGTLLIGSSREFGAGFDHGINERAVQDIMRTARAYLPTLLEESRCEVLETRTGLRPYSASGPIIGPVEGVDNLYVAAGHEGSGLTLAPATSELVFSLLTRS